jgi:deoxycytidylate deaminase
MIKLPKFFPLARSVSRHSVHSKHKIGCVISKSGHPVSVGFNKDKSHTGFDYGVHAEPSAMWTSGREYIDNSTITIYRETKNGFPAMARPCPVCMKLLKNFGIRKVYYTTSDFPYFSLERL